MHIIVVPTGNTYGIFMSRNKYLELQFNTWSVTLKIPNDVRTFFGKTKFMKSLGTHDLGEANILKWKYVELWKKQIKLARGALKNDVDATTDELVERYKLEIATKWKGYEQEALSELADGLSENVDAKKGRFDADEVYMRTAGIWTSTRQHIEEFVKHHDYTPKTGDEAISAIRHFADQFKVFETITDYDVMKYIDALLDGQNGGKGLSIRTVKKRIGFVRTYWDYCIRNRYTKARHYDVLNGSIFPQNKKTKASTSSAIKAKRLPYSVEDYHNLLNAKPDDQQLCDLIKLAAHTGCRREELCGMKMDQVLSDRLIVQDSKTPAGWREIPIHSDIKDLVDRLVANSSDGYLISGLSDENKYHKRGEAIGKRFGRLKQKLGFGTRHVLHSFRNTLITQMMNNGVPVAHTALIVGHGELGFSYDAYGGDIAWSEKVKHLGQCGYSNP